MFDLVVNYEDIISNVKQFNIDIKNGEGFLLQRLSNFKHWYYIPEVDQFGPSKYIGYKDNNAAKYEDYYYQGSDGRVTEGELQQWFKILGDNDPGYDELKQKISTMLKEFRKKPNKGLTIHIPRNYTKESVIGPKEFFYNQGGNNSFPIISDSWVVVSSKKASKKLDKTAFLHRGTGIPKDVRNFFYAENLQPGEHKNVVLTYKGNDYAAYIEMSKHDSPRTRLFWKSDFIEVLGATFPNYKDAYQNNEQQNFEEHPHMIFEKEQSKDDHFQIRLVPPISIDDARVEMEPEDSDDDESRTEGGVKIFLGKRYERDPINRKRAIEIHGLSCAVCNFNFEEAYGELGTGFIEIHHVNPLSQQKGVPKEVNPITDLVPVCSNCHRMIHRNKGTVQEIEELKAMINIRH